MKMDAAEPFNVPVNPEALGIPVSITFSSNIFMVFFFTSNLHHTYFIFSFSSQP